MQIVRHRNPRRAVHKYKISRLFSQGQGILFIRDFLALKAISLGNDFVRRLEQLEFGTIKHLRQTTFHLFLLDDMLVLIFQDDVIYRRVTETAPA